MSKTTIKLYGDAYFASGNYKLPNEDGTPSPYEMDNEWLECHAFDEAGKEYLVLLPEESDEIVILEVQPVDEENENYVAVENEDILDTVYGIFKERYKDVLQFED